MVFARSSVKIYEGMAMKTILRSFLTALLMLCAFCLCNAAEKHVIGCRFKVGLFSNFLRVINHLDWCIKNDKIPVVYWDKESSYYSPEGYNESMNGWEYYFEPVSDQTYNAGDVIHRSYCSVDGKIVVNYTLEIPIGLSPEIRYYVYNNLITPFIKPNQIIQNKVDAFFDKHLAGNYTIGIHIRGTDKAIEIKPVPVETIIQIANDLAAQIPNCQFFVATDDNALLEIAKNTLNGKVIYYDSHRSTNGKPIHNGNDKPSDNSKAILGEEVLIETLLLAKCNKFIHTASNVSISALLFNPELENVFLFAPE